MCVCGYVCLAVVASISSSVLSPAGSARQMNSNHSDAVVYGTHTISSFAHSPAGSLTAAAAVAPAAAALDGAFLHNARQTALTMTTTTTSTTM